MDYRQVTPGERYTMAKCRQARWSIRAIARLLERSPSTIARELRRNRSDHDGAYRPESAQRKAQNRRHLGHRRWRFSAADWELVIRKLEEWWSPEEIAGALRTEGILTISHETIYRFIWRNHKLGGELAGYLRGARKQKRKRYGTYERRGRLTGKRPLADRPAIVAARSRIGDWEIDTIAGTGGKTCLLSLVERATGYLLLGLLPDRSAAGVQRRAIQLLWAHHGRVHTITADNGTEFHQYAAIEPALATEFYFAPPYQAWARGTCENTIGLVRQYLPKGMSFAGLTQAHCTHIARHLNRRPRKRLGYRTPEACYESAA